MMMCENKDHMPSAQFTITFFQNSEAFVGLYCELLQEYGTLLITCILRHPLKQKVSIRI